MRIRIDDDFDNDLEAEYKSIDNELQLVNEEINILNFNIGSAK